MTRLYLASRSPRRRELLRQLGAVFECLDPGIEEARAEGESPEGYVRRLAREKAGAGLLAAGSGDLAVLAADTIVVVDGELLGKPAGEAEALEHLRRLSGRSHRVLSAVALRRRETAVRLSSSTVWFRDLSPAECSAYWSTGEPTDKAGGYGIQGRAAAFIHRLEGSYSGIMGLPLYETAELLQHAGLFRLADP